MTAATYEERKQRLSTSVQNSPQGTVRLGKDTSNLFRDREQAKSAQVLNVRDFNHVLAVDPAARHIDVEGMTPYVDLVAESLIHGVMPAVVPQLKSITIGGATTGCGIEASSFRYGLVHETVQEMEILLADGTVVHCTPNNEHRDLFFGFPNSYGTLGYALKLRILAVPVKPYVKLTHIRYSDPDRYFADLAQWCDKPVDFVDGVIFGHDEMVLTLGTFSDTAPYTSDYTYENIYYQSLQRRDEDYLTIADYIWRWDTDWFWCSKNLHVQHPLVRMLVGRERLNSISYTKVMRWNSRWGITRRLNQLLGYRTESVIQDVELPIEHCRQFFDFYHDTIRFLPIWVCPTRAFRPDRRFDLYGLAPGKLYVNFGFWDVIKGRERHPEGYYNRLVERKVMELGGMKSLYSDSYFTPEEFWGMYNKPVYDGLKQKYDRQGRLKDLYAKCVRRE